MPNSSLATVEEDGGVILSRVQVLAPVGAREVTVVPAAIPQTKPNFNYRQDLVAHKQNGGHQIKTVGN